MHRLLGMILAVGNVLNGGSDKGQADGFNMDIIKLSKPKILKGSNGQSMLQYVCKINTARDPNFPTQIRELRNLLETNKNVADIDVPFR